MIFVDAVLVLILVVIVVVVIVSNVVVVIIVVFVKLRNVLVVVTVFAIVVVIVAAAVFAVVIIVAVFVIVVAVVVDVVTVLPLFPSAVVVVVVVIVNPLSPWRWPASPSDSPAARESFCILFCGPASRPSDTPCCSSGRTCTWRRRRADRRAASGRGIGSRSRIAFRAPRRSAPTRRQSPRR